MMVYEGGVVTVRGETANSRVSLVYSYSSLETAWQHSKLYNLRKKTFGTIYS